MKKFTCFVFVFLLVIFQFSSFVYCADEVIANNELSTYSPVCLLMEAKTGKVLYEKNGYEQNYPASITKLMTAILTVENCSLDEVAKVSYNAVFSVPPDYTNAALQVDEEFTIEQLLNVFLIPSANDAGFVLAEHVAGSTESFVSMMNSKATEIGCLNTHFSNPSGIHADDHYSTAYDLALIGRYAMQYDVIRNIVCKTSYRLPATDKYTRDDRFFVTTNSMLRENFTKYYDTRVTGMKTGYTEHALDCIVATAKQDDLELIAVILKSGYTESGLRQKYLDCKTLFDYGFENYKLEKIALANNVCENIKIHGATSDTENLDLLYKDDISAFVSKDFNIENIQPVITLRENLDAPISANETIGKVEYKIDDISYSCDLIAKSNVEAFPLLEIAIKTGAIIILLFIVLELIRLMNPKKKRKSRKGKHI